MRSAHRRSFAGLLTYMTSRLAPIGGKYGWAEPLAWQLAALLGVGPHYRFRDYFWTRHDRHHAEGWLRAFLVDEPAWEPRLRAWIEHMISDSPRGNV